MYTWKIMWTSWDSWHEKSANTWTCAARSIYEQSRINHIQLRTVWLIVIADRREYTGPVYDAEVRENCCRVELFEHVRYYFATRCPEQVHNCLLARMTVKYLRVYNKNSVEEIYRTKKNNNYLRFRYIYTNEINLLIDKRFLKKLIKHLLKQKCQAKSAIKLS